MAPKIEAKKMDKSRALAIMGFATSRPLDSAMGDAEKTREILDKALFDKTQSVLHNQTKKDQMSRKKSVKRRKDGSYKADDSNNRVKGKPANLMDESLQLHEAYQFLVKKYIPDHPGNKRSKSTTSETEDTIANPNIGGNSRQKSEDMDQ